MVYHLALDVFQIHCIVTKQSIFSSFLCMLFQPGSHFFLVSPEPQNVGVYHLDSHLNLAICRSRRWIILEKFHNLKTKRSMLRVLMVLLPFYSFSHYTSQRSGKVRFICRRFEKYTNWVFERRSRTLPTNTEVFLRGL